ncbi:GntR family transcriptional regulator [Candidatus Burkholderia verschuerenii]|uniref:GntR family transcriptional regulator n=1 Tax=Candidatus Burkholderia verschuerenii TaxID=242163 RepID=UPI0022B724EA|nr:GntR family transcriptional regulator [Candidatus Burkholderia verschuerenii]
MAHPEQALHTIPPEAPRSGDDVYAAIKDALATGRYGAGQYLREEQLAKSLGVSRTPVREALRRLDAEAGSRRVPTMACASRRGRCRTRVRFSRRVC